MQIIAVGIAIIAGGAAAIYFGYKHTIWFDAAFGWAAVIIGALVTLYGFSRERRAPLPKSYQEAENFSKYEVHALVRSLGVMTVADNKVRIEELNAISDMHRQMLGMDISHEEIQTILDEFGPQFDLVSSLEKNKEKFSDAMKRTIILSCHLVMVSDMEVAKREQNMLDDIGKALGFEQREINDMIASIGK